MIESQCLHFTVEHTHDGATCLVCGKSFDSLELAGAESAARVNQLREDNPDMVGMVDPSKLQAAMIGSTP